MGILYHGTDVDNAISIARKVVILSPLEQHLEKLVKIYIEKPEIESYWKGSTLGQFALNSLKSSYGPHEIEHRVKCVSVTKDLSQASSYAQRYEERDGGLVLGIELDDKYIKRMTKGKDVAYIPKLLSIHTLRELHLSKIAKEKCEQLIKKEFHEYNPKYFDIQWNTTMQHQ